MSLDVSMKARRTVKVYIACLENPNGKVEII